MRAARQGSFDSMCGVYAIINALDPAGIKLRRGPLHRDLFKELTHGLGAVTLLAAMHDGIGRHDLLRAAKAAFRWLALEHEVELTIDAPYDGRVFKHPRLFLEALRSHLEADGQAVIVDIYKPGRDHWTVPTAIVGRKLLIRDSGGMASIPLSYLTSQKGDWAISIEDTLVIRSIAKEASQ
jgi:hypothetical protein